MTVMLRTACVLLLIAVVSAALTHSQEQRNATRPYWSTHNSVGSACGAVISAYNGVPARSNGADMGTGNGCAGDCLNGLCYECVELTQRYFYTIHKTVPDWHCGNAIDLCGCHAPGMSITTNPQPGDAVILNLSQWGHTGVITATASDSIKILEQNASPGGVGTYPHSLVKCYLTFSG